MPNCPSRRWPLSTEKCVGVTVTDELIVAEDPIQEAMNGVAVAFCIVTASVQRLIAAATDSIIAVTIGDHASSRTLYRRHYPSFASKEPRKLGSYTGGGIMQSLVRSLVSGVYSTIMNIQKSLSFLSRIFVPRRGRLFNVHPRYGVHLALHGRTESIYGGIFLPHSVLLKILPTAPSRDWPTGALEPSPCLYPSSRMQSGRWVQSLQSISGPVALNLLPQERRGWPLQ